MIRSRRHPVNFYLPIIGVIAFFGGGGVNLIRKSLTLAYPSGEIAEAIIMGIVALGLFYIGIVIIRYFFKHVPIITIDSKGISLGSEFFWWSDVHKARYNQKAKSNVFLNELDATYLDLHDGSSRLFLDSMYLNTLTLKYQIQQQSSGWEPHLIPGPRHYKVPSHLEKGMKTFKEKQSLILPNIIIWGSLLGLLLYVLNTTPPVDTLPYYAIGWVVVFLICSIGMHYVKLNSNFLMIRHVFWFWKKYVFMLQDIEKIIIMKSRGDSFRLRIITKDLTSRTYYFATLSISTSRTLASQLESHGILVEDRVIYHLSK